jgi:hypothetical protein
MDSGSLVLSASNTEAFEQCPSCWPAYSTAWVLWHDASAEALLAHARERYTVLKSRAEKNPGE